VTFAKATDVDNETIDAAYRKKYGYFGNIGEVLGAPRWEFTLVVRPSGT